MVGVILNNFSVFRLTVRRDYILEDAFVKFNSIIKKDLQKHKLYITFASEEG